MLSHYISAFKNRRLRRRSPRRPGGLQQQLAFQELLSQIWSLNPYHVSKPSDYLVGSEATPSQDDHDLQRVLYRLRPKVVIDVGTKTGTRAIAMCEMMRRTYGETPLIVCVDAWGGLREWQSLTGYGETIPILEWWEQHSCGDTVEQRGEIEAFKQFVSSALHTELSETLVPMPIEGRIAAKWFLATDLNPDFVHIDIGHDAQELLETIRAYWDVVRPGGALFGHDYHPDHLGVIQAVHQFGVEHNVTIELDNNTWTILKSRTCAVPSAA